MYKIVYSRWPLFTVVFSLILMCCFSVTADATSTSSIEHKLQQSGYEALPITVKNGFLYVNAFINKYPGTAIIDTGSSGINVTKGTAAKLKLATLSTTKNAGIDMNGKKSFKKSVGLQSVSIGKFQLQNVNASIFQNVSSGGIPTLVVGRDFLKRHYAVIDVYNKKLYLSNRKLTQDEMSKIQKMLMNQHLYAIPLLSLNSGDMVISLQINHSQPANFLFDTGTGITLLSQEYAKKLDLKQSNDAKNLIIEKLTMNPLNLSFQPEITIDSATVQLVNLEILRKHLYVQGIFGLSEIIKSHAIIFSEEGLVFARSG